MDRDEAPMLDIDDQVVLILVGLIASGKSTFGQALSNHFPSFVRCNQDDLGDRRQVENLARRSLRDGLSVCIDRTNIDESQREHWVNIAHEFGNVKIWVLWFDTSYKVCAERLQARTDHPTIRDVQTGIAALSRFSRQFQPPSAHEGYDRLLSLRPSDYPSDHFTSPSDILDILHRLRDAPDAAEERVPLSSQQNSFMQFFRPGGGAGGRGGAGDDYGRGRPYDRPGHQIDRRYPPPYIRPSFGTGHFRGRGGSSDSHYSQHRQFTNSGVCGSESSNWRTTSSRPPGNQVFGEAEPTLEGTQVVPSVVACVSSKPGISGVGSSANPIVVE